MQTQRAVLTELYSLPNIVRPPMKTRKVPTALYQEVFDLATRIAQPFATPIGDVDETAAAEALDDLVALFTRCEDAGTPDPFLTEALADFTSDDTEAIRLYRLALEQAAQFAGEPTHTKRLGLARRLHGRGHMDEAREQLALARRDAFAAGDSAVMEELDELAKELEV